MKKTILACAIIIAAMLLLVSPMSAAAKSQTQTINLNGRTAVYALLHESAGEEDENRLQILLVGDFAIKLPGQKAQIVSAAFGLIIDLDSGESQFIIAPLEDLEATFDWSMYKCILTEPLNEEETGIITLTATEQPTAMHNSIDLGEILDIPDLKLAIRLNAVGAPADLETSFELADEFIFGLIAVGTVNIAFTPPS